MGTAAVMIIGIIIGVVIDHFLEARSVNSIVKALTAAKNEILDEIRGIKGNRAKAAAA